MMIPLMQQPCHGRRYVQRRKRTPWRSRQLNTVGFKRRSTLPAHDQLPAIRGRCMRGFPGRRRPDEHRPGRTSVRICGSLTPHHPLLSWPSVHNSKPHVEVACEAASRASRQVNIPARPSPHPLAVCSLLPPASASLSRPADCGTRGCLRTRPSSGASAPPTATRSS